MNASARSAGDAAGAIARRERTCLHCGGSLDGIEVGSFCCTGCRAVYTLLTSQHLDRYYALRGPRGVPAVEADAERRDHKWIDAVSAARATGGDPTRIDLDIQGVHCSACVWLVNTLFRRRAGAVAITVNPSLGSIHMLVGPSFDLRAFVTEVERFGYRLGPALKRGRGGSHSLVLRMGICVAIAMNAMIFAVATYAGLREGPTYDLVLRWSMVLSVASVVVGGSVFFQSAWQGIRRGVLHLDLPIALGILLAFGGSLYGYVSGHHRGVFVDTLDVFIALMLVGRFLQERVLERNRAALLADDGIDGLLARRRRGPKVEIVRCAELAAGDEIVIAPGDLVPVDAVLQARRGASFSLDWINGESRARAYAFGDVVPAGAFLAGTSAVTVVARDDFSKSPLRSLLRSPVARPSDAAMSLPWWRKLAKWYVAAVLAAAAVGFAMWMLRTHDLARSIEVTTAVLIVTCPCAFGIATPLAYDLVQAGLRRAGLFVRSPGFLDRAARVRKVVFDKTGTLTTGRLAVADPDALAKLPARQRRILTTLAASSSHPKSAAVMRALPDEPAERCDDVVEVPGVGLSVTREGRTWRLGAPAWVAPKATARGDLQGDLAFGVDGEPLADITTVEALRPDARREVRALANAGYDVWLLSGDDFARVAQTARTCGIAADHAIGGRSAEGKAAWVAEHDRGDLLMIGDGINDSLVVANAFCSGTPAIDRPFMAARSDFYFVTPGLRPIRVALLVAKKLASVRARNLSIAVAYNVLTVALAYTGLMSPLLCAVLMPASSLTTVLTTTLTLRGRSRLWRS